MLDIIIIHSIQEVHRGHAQDPSIFFNENLAGEMFETRVSSEEIAFRKKEVAESWQEYYTAFIALHLHPGFAVCA